MEWSIALLNFGSALIFITGGCTLLLLILDFLSRKLGVFKNGIIGPLFLGQFSSKKDSK